MRTGDVANGGPNSNRYRACAGALGRSQHLSTRGSRGDDLAARVARDVAGATIVPLLRAVHPQDGHHPRRAAAHRQPRRRWGLCRTPGVRPAVVRRTAPQLPLQIARHAQQDARRVARYEPHPATSVRRPRGLPACRTLASAASSDATSVTHGPLPVGVAWCIGRWGRAAACPPCPSGAAGRRLAVRTERRTWGCPFVRCHMRWCADAPRLGRTRSNPGHGNTCVRQASQETPHTRCDHSAPSPILHTCGTVVVRRECGV